MSSTPSWGIINVAYVLTKVDRATRCILGWDVLWERTTEPLQDLVERSLQAAQYHSDDFAPYHTLVYYPGHHAVEADNAELRYYLARLSRRSRCFSRSIETLRQAVKLFVHAWNSRQLHKRAFPRYACHVMDFVCP